MATLSFYEKFRFLNETKHYSNAITDILDDVISHGLSTMRMIDYLDSHNIKLDDIKSELIDVILDYADLLLDDDYLSAGEIQIIRDLRRYFKIEDGEVLEYGKRERVEAILIGQLEKLYEDNKIDREEMLRKSSLQGLFGLGYDDYQDIVNKVAIEAYSRGADIRDLDTYL